MKKFTLDRPGYGMFDLPVANDSLEASIAYENLSGTRHDALPFVWDAARAERKAPFRFYRNIGKRALDLIPMR